MSAHVPKIALSLPRPVVALHQIEITSRCNLRCSYCYAFYLTYACQVITHDPPVETFRQGPYR